MARPAYWKPDPFVVRIFFGEIQTRCKDALIAEELVGQGSRTDDWNLFWFGMRSILYAAAVISNLAGTDKGPRWKEREAVRTPLAIDKASVLHKRSIRDAVAHMDTEILRQRHAGKLRNYIGHGIGLKAPNAVGGIDPAEFFLDYEPSTGMLSFTDKSEISIPELLAEIRRILPLAAAAWHQPINVQGLNG